MRHFLAAIASLTAGLPAVLAGQGDCRGILGAPASGGWSEYVVQTPRNRVPTSVRYAIVGTEQREGNRHVRFETRIRGADGATSMVSQVVVPDFPYEQIALQEAVLQQGSAQPIQLGPAMLARARASSMAPLTRLVVDGCSGSELVGQEEVTVPAGTFATSHYRNAGAGSDIWVSREVPFGIVKLTGRDGASMELMGHGKDARSSLSGEPRVVNGAN